MSPKKQSNDTNPTTWKWNSKYENILYTVPPCTVLYDDVCCVVGFNNFTIWMERKFLFWFKSEQWKSSMHDNRLIWFGFSNITVHWKPMTDDNLYRLLVYMTKTYSTFYVEFSFFICTRNEPINDINCIIYVIIIGRAHFLCGRDWPFLIFFFGNFLLFSAKR